jgi:hypothetical protein
MHYIHLYKVPLPIVQKQVGHRSLRATSVYLSPSDELVSESYSEARQVRMPRKAQGHTVATKASSTR